MAHGGARSNAGRKPGSLTTKTREVAEKAAEAGITPLEFMLSILRDETAGKAERFEAAKQAAPYIHPKLSSVEAKVEGELKTTVRRIERVVVDPQDRNT
jgi:hypothetical protein